MTRLDWDGARRREIVKRRGPAHGDQVELPVPAPRTDADRVAELQQRVRRELESYVAAKQKRATPKNLKMRAKRIRRMQARITQLGG